MYKSKLSKTSEKTIVITGATGWIGRHVYHALKNLAEYNCRLILIDVTRTGCNHADLEYGNGKEPMESLVSLPEIPQEDIIKIDLAEDSAQQDLEELFTKINPDLLFHLAAVLDNAKKEDIEKNKIIDRNVLTVSKKLNIKIIAASSLMTMFGLALSNPSILSIFKKQKIELLAEEKLTVDIPIKGTNTLDLIKIICANEERAIANLTYISAKEELEKFAEDIVSSDNTQTMIMVRFGWTGMRDPRELEKESEFTQIPIRIHPKDLSSFIEKLTLAVLSEKVTGYKIYICVSSHPQSWVDIKEPKQDFNWEPQYIAGSEYESKSLLANYRKPSLFK